jgi:hypothetical protein
VREGNAALAYARASDTVSTGTNAGKAKPFRTPDGKAMPDLRLISFFIFFGHNALIALAVSEARP